MPPQKPKVKKKGAKENKKDEEVLKIKRKLKELEIVYDKNCITDHSLSNTELKRCIRSCIDKGKHLSKIIIDEEISPEGLTVKLAPIIAAIRSIRYIFIKEIYVWDIHTKYEDLAALSQFLEQPVYSTSYAELNDCKIDAFSMERFSRCLMASTLTTLVLDYNVFGDEGCRFLCSGLANNKTLLKLSLNYCDLQSESGTHLGKLVSETAVSALYLDGNQLECEGIIELLKIIVDRAEVEILQKEEEKKAVPVSATKPSILLGVKTSMSEIRAASASSVREDAIRSGKLQSGISSGGTKKKKKKSAKKIAIPAAPKVGPWLEKLHVMNNGIDAYGIAAKYAPVICMRLVKQWIANSADLQELDIDDNIIGDLGGREILDGLQKRKQAGLNSMKIWITHRMNSETFTKILSLGSGGAKKGKKKKRGKAGKKRV